ncbi:MAG: branched-chain amino acid ABC transporter permease [Burkholderiaceae bacterium]|nr:branched-chain amino acid ABC transporter permease [Burkholderiaceae bacterium]
MFWEQVINGLALGSIYALIAVGYSLQLSILRVFNLAHGEIMMLSTFAAYVAMSQGAGFGLAVLAAVACGVVLGLLLERFALRPIKKPGELAPLIVTIGVGALLQSGAVLMFGYEQRSFPRPQVSGFDLGFAYVTTVQIAILGIGLLTLIGLNLLVHRSRFGRAVRATAELPRIAEAFGVNVARVQLMTIAFSSGLGALAGILIAMNFGVVTPFLGATFALKALMVVIIGGRGSINGAFFSGIALGLLELVVAGQFLSEYRDAVAFAALLLVLILRPEGLLPSAKTR